MRKYSRLLLPLNTFAVVRSCQQPFPLDLIIYSPEDIISQPKCSSFPEMPQPELMLTTTRGRATVAGLDSSQEYALQVLVLNGTTEKLLAKRRFTSKKHSKVDGRNSKS